MFFWNILWFLEYYCWPLSFTFLTLQRILWSSLNMEQVEISLVVWIYHIGKRLMIMWMYSTVLYDWQRMGLCFALPLIFCKHTCANIIRWNGNYIGQILSRGLWCAEPFSNFCTGHCRGQGTLEAEEVTLAAEDFFYDFFEDPE